MNFKCSITRQKCQIDDFEFDNVLCPFYKSGNYRYKPTEGNFHYDPSKGEQRTVFCFDDTCRFYGIKRSEEIKGRDWLDK